MWAISSLAAQSGLGLGQNVLPTLQRSLHNLPWQRSNADSEAADSEATDSGQPGNWHLAHACINLRSIPASTAFITSFRHLDKFQN